MMAVEGILEIDQYMVGDDTVADDIPCYDTVADDIPCYDGCYSSNMEVVKVETVLFVRPDVYLRQF